MAHNTTHNPIETTVESADFKVTVSIDYGRLQMTIDERDKPDGVSITTIDKDGLPVIRVTTERFVEIL